MASTNIKEPLLKTIVGEFHKRQTELGLTDEDLAKASGISRPVLSGLRSGKKTGVQFNTLEKIAAALKWELTVDYLELK